MAQETAIHEIKKSNEVGLYSLQDFADDHGLISRASYLDV